MWTSHEPNVGGLVKRRLFPHPGLMVRPGAEKRAREQAKRERDAEVKQREAMKAKVRAYR